MTEREALFLLEDAPAGSGTDIAAGSIDLRAHVAAIEESLIRQALDRSNGIVAQAARLLGMRRTTLVGARKFESARLTIRKIDSSSCDDVTCRQRLAGHGYCSYP